MSGRADSSLAGSPDHSALYAVLDTVTDPEVPVLTVLDLGVVRDVQQAPDGKVTVTITPTYSGCPAMNVIEINIRAALQEAGYDAVEVRTVLRPAWTTAWMTQRGKDRLREYGIAPPQEATADPLALFGEAKVVPCPQCQSTHTKLISQFGSTACKAMYKCLDCLEPFDYFKCL